MPGDMNPWEPNDWEEHIQKVLKLRYAQPVGSYQHIADEIKGDCGLEGFAVDGTAYQCYACQNWNDFGVLLNHQNAKMTLDIGKLLRNEAELLTILGDIRKRRFIQVGFAAWCILLALAVTSPTFILRAMGGKSWQWLHRLIYVAGVLAMVHYWWLVKSGVLTPWKDTAVLTILLLARVAYSIAKRLKHPIPAVKPAGVR